MTIACLLAVTALTLALVPPHAGIAQASDQPTPPHQGCGRDWISLYGDDPARPANQGYQDGVAATALSPDGERLYVTGHERNGQRTDAVTVARAADGDLLWVARVESAQLSSIAVSPHGSHVFVTGYIVPGGRGWPDLLTVAYDADTGKEIWRDVFGAERWDQGMDVAVSPDGTRVYVTGSLRQTDWTQPLNDAVTLAYDAISGERAWVAVREPDMQNAGSLAVSPDGRTLLVVGSVNAAGTEEGAIFPHTTTFVVAYVARDSGAPSREGSERWSAHWDPGPLPGDRANDGGPVGIALSPEGDQLYVVASTGHGDLSNSSRFYDWMTLAYDTTTGQQLWDASYRGPFGGSTQTPGDNRPTAIVASPNGDGVFVSGWSAAAGNNSDFVFATVAYDASGNELWVDRFGSPEYRIEGASDAAVSADGRRLFVTGANIPYLASDAVRQQTVVYDTATGRVVSTPRFDDFRYDSFVNPRLDVAPDGKTVFVSGGASNVARGADSGDYWDWFSVAHDVAPSFVAVSRVGRATEGVEVAGQLTLCGDALRPVHVSIDAVGDAAVSGTGLDLVEGVIRPEMSAEELVFTLKVLDRESVNGDEAPATGYGWPVAVDGSDDGLWLGAGTAASGLPTELDMWWGLCTEQTPATGLCGESLDGNATNRAVSWKVPFDTLGAAPGSIISAGSAHSGAPASFHWLGAGFTQGVAPADVAPPPASYQIPGEVLIGFAPAHVAESDVQFSATRVADPDTGAFSGTLAGPAANTEYRVWVKSCFGPAESPTCVTGSSAPVAPATD